MARQDPHSYFDSDQPLTKDLDWKINVNFKEKRLEGVMTLHLAEPSAGAFDLDTRDLRIDDVKNQKGEAVPFEWGEPDEVLGRRLRLNLPGGTESVAIRYASSPDAVALQWLAPQQTLGRRQPFLFSQCQPHHARTMAPLQDSPRARVTYKAELTVPEALTAVMAAASTGSSAGPEPGTKTYRFEMPQPVPTYLIALAVGDLASQDIGPRSRIWAEPEAVKAAAWEFAEIEDMIATAEKLFGPYEWDRYDMINLPPSFPYGGMENPRLTFLTPTIIAGDRSLVSVVAHELAHSWTGNLVTNANINHFWLNEGFTVWAERRIQEAMRGEDYAAMQWTIGLSKLRNAMEEFGPGSPYTKLETELEGVNPDDVYSEVPYEKGALFVRLMEDTVGREAWGSFIRDYIREFRFTSITTEELMGFVESKFPGLAEKVGADEWLHKPDLPANAPRFKTARLDRLHELAEGWKSGVRPPEEETAKWIPEDTMIYMQNLPRTMSLDDCAWLDEHFNLNESGNYEILVEWLTIAAGSDYQPALPRVRKVLNEVGRMKYVQPLYKALGNHADTRKLAREIFAETRDRVHTLTRQVAEAAMKAYPAD